jgi:pSer/pThr/pTyr-binding forkhead associated (FHA) protein
MRPAAAVAGAVPQDAGGPALAPERTAGALVVYRARGRTKATFDVRDAVATIGRTPGHAVVVRAAGVSRQHARITWDGAAYWIEDLESRNGTYVNGLAVPRHGKERLRHLDVIRLGRRAHLLVLMPAAPVRVVKRPGVVRATLQALEGDVSPHEITPGGTTLGRDAVNQVVVGVAAVSKVHARLHRTAEHVTVQDLGSSNGTFVNGTRVAAALLEDGDRLCLGGVVKYRIEIETADVWFVADGAPARPPAGDPGPDRPEGLDTLAEADSEGEGVAADEARRDLAPDTERMPRPLLSPIARVRLAGRGIELSVGAPGTYVIGRAEEAALRVDHPTVSRVHAKLSLAPDRTSARVEHAGASASLLNGRELEGAADLTDGDLLQLGDVRMLVSFEPAAGGPRRV